MTPTPFRLLLDPKGMTHIYVTTDRSVCLE